MNDVAKFGLSMLVGYAIASVFGFMPALAITCLWALRWQFYALGVLFVALRRVRGDRPDMLENF